MTYSRNTISAASPVKSLGLLSVASMTALLTLSACSNAPRELISRTVETEANRPPKVTALPEPEPIETLPVEFQVIREDDGALFCLTSRGYENLAKTQADILRWVRETKWRLDYYERELNDAESTADSDNEEADR